jgi:polyhydroxyalkanoate synthase subunit PhaC
MTTNPRPDAPLEAMERLADGSWRAFEVMHTVLTAHKAPVGTTPKEVIWRKNKAQLYRYTRSTPATRRTPVFLVLPLINRAYILDLRPGASFVQYLVEQGFDVFMLDWGIPGDEDRGLDLDALLVRYLRRALVRAREAAGVKSMTLLGYCIGGTLATCYTALFGDEPVPVKNLVLFTAPIDFANAGLFGTWTARDAFPIDELTDIYPALPGSMPDLGSKMLRPLPTTIGTYIRLYDRLGDPSFDIPGWQAMYRWVNEGVPFPSAAYRQWIKDFYQSNKLALGTLSVDGQRVRLGDIRCPLLNVAASADQIAPRPTTSAIMRLVGSTDAEEIVLKGGHVGIVVGRAAATALWPRVSEWLDRHDR